MIDFGSPIHHSIMMCASGKSRRMSPNVNRFQSGSVALIHRRLENRKRRINHGRGRKMTGMGIQVCDSIMKYLYGV